MLQMTVPSLEAEPADERAHTHFVLLEAEMLGHHLSETLMRLFLAHRSGAAVPWIEVAGMKHPGAFKRALESVLDEENAEALRIGAGYVWLGTETLKDSDEEWANATERIVGYLLHFARFLVDHASTYNSAKHGLAVQPGDTKLGLVGVPGLSVEGPSLAWLDEEERASERVYVVRNRWFKLETTLALAVSGQLLLNALWNVARVRYVGWPRPDRLFVPHSIDELLGHLENPDEEAAGITIESAAFPPAMFCPPGAGSDRLNADLHGA